MTDFSPENMTVANGPKPFTPRADDPTVQVNRPTTASTPTSSTPAGSSTGIKDSDLLTPPTPPKTPMPTPTPSPTPSSTTTSTSTAPPAAEIPAGMPEVKGRIEIHDEVVEKVAGLAAMEVEGVADLGGDIARALESVRDRIGVGNKRGDQGIKAKVTGREVTIDVTLMIEYGHVVMDVARNVKYNVANQTSRMLGLKVVEVNVVVDDVKLPEPEKPAEAPEEDGLVIGS